MHEAMLPLCHARMHVEVGMKSACTPPLGQFAAGARPLPLSDDGEAHFRLDLASEHHLDRPGRERAHLNDR